MDRQVILTQLWAIRAICDALAAQLQAETAPTTGGCEHPESARENAQTMGGPRQFYCRACKNIIDDQ